MFSDADPIRDILIPAAILTAVTGLLFFILQVATLLFAHASLAPIKLVALCFVLGVIMTTRLSVKHGPGSERAYRVALASVTVFYLLFACSDSGLFGFAGLTFWPAFPLSIMLLAFLWWFTARLTRECTIMPPDLAETPGDPSPETAAAGMIAPLITYRYLAGAAADFMNRTNRSDTSLTIEIERTPANEFRAAADITPEKHPARLILLLSVVATFLFGFGGRLLLHTTATHLANGYRCMFAYVLATAVLLMLSSINEMRVRIMKTGSRMDTTTTMGWLAVGLITIGLLFMTAYGLPHFEKREFGSLTPPPDFTTASNDASAKTDDITSRRESTSRPPVAPVPPLAPALARLAAVIAAGVVGLIICFGLWKGVPALLGLLRREERRNTAQRATRTEPPPVTAPDEGTPGIRKVDFRLSFAAAGLHEMPVVEAVEHVYHALMVVLIAAGPSAMERATPLERLHLIPPSMRHMEPVIHELTELFITVSYTDRSPPGDSHEKLEKAWNELRKHARH
ncbi:hypothetical protein JW905_09635 [bacterium]|nr:hypothetical protein [candidate division CSSED10-310 bacterium]